MPLDLWGSLSLALGFIIGAIGGYTRFGYYDAQVPIGVELKLNIKRQDDKQINAPVSS